jgi:tetrahydromethanopterin S-methyltransferase subunit G
MRETTSIEKENLEAHVELCAERYKQVETRLTGIEKKVENLQSTIERSHASTIKALVGAAGSIVAGVLTIVVVILYKSL